MYAGQHNLSTMSAFLLLAVLNTVVIFRGCFAKQVYYVTPRSDTVCPSTTSSATCQTLMHYASRSHYYFQSDTTFYFLSGTHWLMTEEPLTILAIHRLLMIGDSQLVPSSQSFISLEPSAVNSSGGGIVFGIVESLLIANLSFVHCGTNLSKVVDLFPYIPQQNYSQYIVFALAFFLVEDLDLSGVLVQNSTGYGLGTLEILA